MNNTIDDEEQVARILFAPSFICDGKVSPTAFRWEVLPSGHVEDYISVLRNDGNDLAQQSEHFRPRVAGDQRYGYALLPISGIKGLDSEFENRKVEILAKPSTKLANHAGVYVFFDDVKVTALTPVSADIMLIQKELSLLCGEPIPFEGEMATRQK